MFDLEAHTERIKAILGDEDGLDFDDLAEKFCEYLKTHLELPCEVSESQDFRWEERYIIGGWDQGEHEQLKKTQPSDLYELIGIERGVYSEWMIYRAEDIAAHVQRKSDDREFCLGLAELKATDKQSSNCQLIHDYAVWFVTSR